MVAKTTSALRGRPPRWPFVLRGRKIDKRVGLRPHQTVTWDHPRLASAKSILNVTLSESKGQTGRTRSRRSARHPGREWPSVPHPELALLRKGSGT